MYLKFKPKKCSLNLGICPKIAPRYCGPFEILTRIGSFAYEYALLACIQVHNVFHVSLLKKYVPDPNHVIDWALIQVELEEDMQLTPMYILDRKVTLLRNGTIS